MKKSIKIGIPESFYSDLFIFLKNHHIFKNFNIQFIALPNFNILEDLFKSKYLNLLISYPSYLYDHINKGDTSVYLLDILSMFQSSIFTHKKFLKFNFNSNLTLRIAIPRITIYYKIIIKKFLSFLKINNIKIKWLEIPNKYIEFYFENNLLDVALVFEKYSYALITKNVANLIDCSFNKNNIPGFSFFYKNHNLNIGLDSAYSVINEIKKGIFHFLKKEDLKTLFIQEFPQIHRHFVTIFLKNSFDSFNLKNKKIDKNYFYFNKKSKVEKNILINKNYSHLLEPLHISRSKHTYNKIFHYIINLKKIPDTFFSEEIKIFIHTYNNLLFENNILKKKLINQINKNSILKDDIENLKITLYQNFLQLKDISDNLIVEKIRAQEANKAKTNFFASITHDLKTPLIGIISLTEMLLESEKDREKIAKLKIIMNSSNMLLELINNILTASKTESVKVSVSQKIFSLKTIISEIKENIKAKLTSKSVDLIIDIDSNIPDILIGDPLKIKQIIFNLLGNSAKFTKQGFIKLTIKKGKQELKDLELIIEVKDSGIGIEKSKLKKIFLPFEQAEDNISENYGGTGLGLAIVKKFVELMGGQINVTSELYKGTTFTLNIYCKIVTDSKGDMVHHSLNKMDKAKLLFAPSNILIAEDNEINQFVIKEYLKEFKNIKYDLVENGKQALDYFSKNKYNLILTDIQMPVMDGIELCKQIRKIDSSIPIIAFSAYDEDFVKEFKIIGFTEIAKKPYKKETLFSLFSKFIGIKDIDSTDKREAEKKLNDSVKVSNEKKFSNNQNGVKEKIIFNKLKKKINSLNNESDKIKKLFIQSLLNYYKDLKSNKNNIEKIKFVLHNIKGTAMIGGLEHLSKQANLLSKHIKENDITDKTIYSKKIDEFLDLFLSELETLL